MKDSNMNDCKSNYMLVLDKVKKTYWYRYYMYNC